MPDFKATYEKATNSYRVFKRRYFSNNCEKILSSYSFMVKMK